MYLNISQVHSDIIYSCVHHLWQGVKIMVEAFKLNIWTGQYYTATCRTLCLRNELIVSVAVSIAKFTVNSEQGSRPLLIYKNTVIYRLFKQFNSI